MPPGAPQSPPPGSPQWGQPPASPPPGFPRAGSQPPDFQPQGFPPPDFHQQGFASPDFQQPGAQQPGYQSQREQPWGEQQPGYQSQREQPWGEQQPGYQSQREQPWGDPRSATPPPVRPTDVASAEPPEPPRKSRRGLWISLATVLVLVLAAAGGAVAFAPDRVRELLGQTTPVNSWSPDAVASAAGVLSAATGTAPTAEQVKAALEELRTHTDLGPSVSVSVVDVATGESLYDAGSSHPAVPASTTKMATAASVLATRGPDYRITTKAVAGPNEGEVVLVGAGDPTLTAGATGYYPGAGRLDQLAAQVKTALGGKSPTKLIYDTSIYTGSSIAEGWDDDAAVGPYGARTTALAIDGARTSPKRPKNIDDLHAGQARSAQPDKAAALAFAKLLGVPASSVTAGTAPSGAQQLGAVQSPRIESLVEIMLEESDNVVAEALARQVALAKGQPGSYAGAGTAIKQVLSELGVPTTGVVIKDGSGLSRLDRQPPAMQTALLAQAAGDKHPQLRSLFAGLPVGAWSGTLSDRNTTTAGTPESGAGVVRAKTGTLTGVAAIAGIVVTKDGRLLAFSFLADAVPSGTDTARERLDAMTNALAAL
ncbi:D-alanyl-D-alanine carboxypeptidase/D-alanyl-D-alanine-endopeptidase [Hamadaea sp. NPDC051192]|uniref:D-alanyl-D-alanine carboxypeptidase/D-alanyl-D-alanine endopeptidase n=1 Tax=Hamadaea sp. NPDC051192 TaxID=3154940 RepID=UPI003432EB8A